MHLKLGSLLCGIMILWLSQAGAMEPAGKLIQIQGYTNERPLGLEDNTLVVGSPTHAKINVAQKNNAGLPHDHNQRRCYQ